MARIRTIKPSFFTSLPIASLSFRCRLTFVGLWTHVDDAGRAVYEPRLIKAALFPLDDTVTAEDVAEDVAALQRLAMVTVYEVEGRKYIQVNGFKQHQHINRARESDLPAPADGSVTEASVKAHGGLTEDSRQEGKGMERKGKEGKPRTPTARADGMTAPHFPNELRVQLRDAWRAKVGAVDMARFVKDLAPIFDRPEAEWGFTRAEVVSAIGFGYEWCMAADRRSRRPFEVPNYTPARFAGNFTRYLGYVREGMATPDGMPTSFARWLDVPEVA